MATNRRAEVEAALADVDFGANSYQVELNTSEGKITLKLFTDRAPGHCRNLIGLTRIGFYDGLDFHRVIEGFMIQGGCPLGTGTGGPGYSIDAEFNDTQHEAGVLSMARSSNPNSGGSQFFVCLESHSHLDNQYTAFGRTADAASLEVVRKIGEVSTDASDHPTTPVTIESATVVATPV